MTTKNRECPVFEYLSMARFQSTGLFNTLMSLAELEGGGGGGGGGGGPA